MCVAAHSPPFKCQATFPACTVIHSQVPPLFPQSCAALMHRSPPRMGARSRHKTCWVLDCSALCAAAPWLPDSCRHMDCTTGSRVPPQRCCEDEKRLHLVHYLEGRRGNRMSGEMKCHQQTNQIEPHCLWGSTFSHTCKHA